MSDDEVRAVNLIQEPPSTSLTGTPRDIYETSKRYIARWSPMNPPPDRCSECDVEIVLDEPQQCYYTGRGPCGDCEHGCFGRLLCEECVNDNRPVLG